MSGETIACTLGLLHPQSTVDCRVYERLPSDRETSCQPVAARGDEDLKWPACVRDVSPGGIGLILGRRFERGAGLAIEIPETATEPAYTLLVRVVRVASADGKWLLGCRFLSELSEDGIRAFLKSARPRHSSHELAVPQVTKTPEPSKTRIANVQFVVRLRRGRVVRRFVKRLTLSGPWPYARGHIVNGQAGRADEARSPFKLKVWSCVQTGNGWILRCKFVQPPSATVLQLFGYKGLPV